MHVYNINILYIHTSITSVVVWRVVQKRYASRFLGSSSCNGRHTIWMLKYLILDSFCVYNLILNLITWTVCLRSHGGVVDSPHVGSFNDKCQVKGWNLFLNFINLILNYQQGLSRCLLNWDPVRLVLTGLNILFHFYEWIYMCMYTCV